ncbi:uncharacterized protein TRUGW13939_04926 [Talaromyces rugulosus]|uniref:L-asparaginase II n=1 Tax=Talaromyces rugulosus TaxID=121627 RepID=A0A7H8QVH1_TALRU|nr:uncharacterized protein TRUGW13939_04926 [Talaromyces rugulosus]QKX57806.1 hypothetical protein TRUGW13939_04926 [Talaromyces rugulosus]
MISKTPILDCVVIDRGGVVENRHQVHAAVVDAQGRLLYAVGDPYRVTLARSTAKPAQALAILETGAMDKFGFDDADLALICSSHSSEEQHISRVLSMMSKVGVGEKDLRCGGHPALSESVNRLWAKNDYTPTPSRSNCSGKHVGMLAGSKAAGAKLVGYHLPDHPMQLRVKRVIEQLSGLDADDVKWAIDGCNLPAPALPLINLAQLCVSFPSAADVIHQNTMASKRTHRVARIFHAMTQFPELVGGEDRFCTTLMTAFQGDLFGKTGAEGCYTIGIRASEETRQLGADGAIAIAVKIEDGNLSALHSAVIEILAQLHIGTPATRKEMGHFHYPKLLNTTGVVTGQVSHLFQVRSALE